MKFQDMKPKFKQQKGGMMTHPMFPDIKEIPMPMGGNPQKLSIFSSKLPTGDLDKMKKNVMPKMSFDMKATKMGKFDFSMKGTGSAPIAKKAAMLGSMGGLSMPEGITLSMPKSAGKMDSIKFESMMGSGRGLEGDAHERVRQQVGLPMWGDKDRDGVPNILDCWPMNKKRQGPENNVDGGDSESTPLETYDVPSEEQEPEKPNLETYGEEQPEAAIPPESVETYNVYTTGPETNSAGFYKQKEIGRQIGESARVVYGKAKEGYDKSRDYLAGQKEAIGQTAIAKAVKKRYAEAMKTPQEREAETIARYGGGAKGADIYKQIKAAQIREAGLTERRRMDVSKGSRSSKGSKPQFTVGTVGAASAMPMPSGFGAASMSQIGGSGVGIMESTMFPRYATPVSGITDFTALPRPTTNMAHPMLSMSGGEQAMPSQPITDQPIEPPQQYQPAPSAGTSIARSSHVCPPGMVFSTRSRRCVAFQRGTYKKHGQEQQQQ